ncbi:adenosine deaminase [Vibrio sp.]
MAKSPKTKSARKTKAEETKDNTSEVKRQNARKRIEDILDQREFDKQFEL